MGLKMIRRPATGYRLTASGYRQVNLKPAFAEATAGKDWNPASPTEALFGHRSFLWPPKLSLATEASAKVAAKVAAKVENPEN